MTHLTSKLKKDGFVKPGGKVLDLGGGKGFHSVPLSEEGMKVTLVDKKPSDFNNEFISSEMCDVRDYKIKGKYDVVLCYNVLPFLDKKSEVRALVKDCMKHLKKGGVFVFTLWGPSHEWAGKRLTHISPELYLLLRNYDVYYMEEKEGMVTVMNGSKAYWHAHEFWVTK